MSLHRTGAAPGARRARPMLPPLVSAAVVGAVVSWNLTNVGAAADTVAGHFGVALPAVGVLTSALFVAQFLVQIPVGRVIDRVGSRPAGIACLALCLVANGLLLVALPFAAATALRFLVGVAVALGFVAGASWARAAGAAFAQGVFGAAAIGGAGVAVATVPLLAETIGWRAPFASAAVVAGTALVLVLALSVAPPHRPATSPARLGAVLADRRILRFGAVNVATFGSSVVLGNWVVPFLLRHGPYTPASAGVVGGLLLIGAMVGRVVGGMVGRTGPGRARTVVVASTAVGGGATLLLAGAAAVPAVAVVSVLASGVAAGLPFGPVFSSAAAARPDAPAAAIAAVSVPAVASIFLGTPLVGLTFAGSTQGRSGIVAIGVLWAATILVVPSRAAFEGGATSRGPTR